MKVAYPIILTPVEEGGFAVKVPDLDIHTQGKDIANAMYMSRDAISISTNINGLISSLNVVYTFSFYLFTKAKLMIK